MSLGRPASERGTWDCRSPSVGGLQEYCASWRTRWGPSSVRLAALASPFEVEIQPSAACQLGCSYCIGARLGQTRFAAARLEPGDLNSLLDECSGHRVARFRLSGLSGDPLAPGVQAFTLDFARKAIADGRQVGVFTNGLGLDEDAVLALTGAEYVNLGLDAGTRDTYVRVKGRDRFADAIQALQRLSLARGRFGPREFGIVFVVTPENVGEVGMVLDLAAEVGAGRVRLRPSLCATDAASAWAWELAQQHALRHPLSRRVGLVVSAGDRRIARRPESLKRCDPQWLCTTVGPDGLLYPCDHLTGTGTSLGDVRRDGFWSVWRAAVAGGRLGQVTPHCRTCPPFAAVLDMALNSEGQKTLPLATSAPIADTPTTASLVRMGPTRGGLRDRRATAGVPRKASPGVLRSR